MFENLFNKCPHEYKQVGFIPFTFMDEDLGRTIHVHAYFYECKKCKKRFVSRECDFYYTETALDMMKLWEKGQLNIAFKNPEYSQYEWDVNAIPIKKESSSSLDYLEAILGNIQDELNRFNLPIHDSENRLILNNIRGIIKNALTVEVDNEEAK